jgi:glycosyltransferase involved in cell wall biosynthesis
MTSERTLDDVDVLFVVPHSPQSVGYESGEEFLSIATYHKQYCRTIQSLGATVELVYLDDEPPVGDEQDYNIKTMPVSIGSTFGREFSSHLCYRLWSTSPDIVHIHGYNQPNVLPLFWSLWGSSAKVVVQNHGGPLDFGDRAHRLWYALVRFHILRSVETVLSVNTEELENLKRAGISEQHLKHVPNAVDTDQFRPYPTDKARNELGLSKDRRYLLFVGKITENKGVSFLIEALIDLPEDVHLLLVYSSEVINVRTSINNIIEENGLEDRVRFVGQVTHDRLPIYYNAADVAVFPSINEGFGVVTIEAMACGTPVVGTTEHLGGGHLIDGKNALLAEAGSSADLSEKIAQLLEDESISTKISHQGRKTAREEYSWDRVGQILADVYQI